MKRAAVAVVCVHVFAGLACRRDFPDDSLRNSRSGRDWQALRLHPPSSRKPLPLPIALSATYVSYYVSNIKECSKHGSLNTDCDDRKAGEQEGGHTALT